MSQAGDGAVDGLRGMLAVVAVACGGAAGAQETVLDGTWITGCEPIGKNGRHGFIAEVTIAGDAIATTAQLYARNSCDVPTVRAVHRGELVERSGADGQVDFAHRVAGLVYILNADEVTAHYNADAAGAGCGFDDWETNVPREVAGRVCAPFAFAEAGTVLYERAWIEGDTLRFGGFPTRWDASAPELRAAEPAGLTFHRVGPPALP